MRSAVLLRSRSACASKQLALGRPVAPSWARSISLRRRPLHRLQAQESQPTTAGEAVPTGFFTNAFKAALTDALDRSAASGGELSGISDFSSLSAAPRMQLPPAPSAQEDMLGAALEASRLSLSRLTAIKNEVDRAIEREQMQVERLEFAVDKATKDEAYYRVLRVLQERGDTDSEASRD